MPSLLNPSAVLGSISTNIQRLLTNFRYTVPDYQREFSWQQDQFEQLWEDIKETYNQNVVNGGIINDPIPHFLGAVVVQAHNDGGEYQEVIDGQQRLTTLSCFISVLYEFADQIVDQRIKVNQTTALASMLFNVSGGDRLPKFKLGVEDDFFRQSVIERNSNIAREQYWSSLNLRNRPVAQRIKAALIFFHEKIAQFLHDSRDRDISLVLLIQVISELVILLKLTVNEHRMAYALFEALNFRGLDLSQADLLKNELLRRSRTEDARRTAANKWLTMISELNNQERVNLPQYIQFHYTSNYGSIKANKLFETISKKMEDGSIRPPDYSENLTQEASRLVKVVNGDRIEWSGAENALKDLIDPLDVKFVYPFLLAAASRFIQQPDLFVKMAINARNFCFRFFKIQEESVSSLERVMRETSLSLRDPTKSPEDIVNIFHTESSDETFSEKFRTAQFSASKMGFYTIWSIEDRINNSAGMNVTRQSPNQHLEHIMPKRLGVGWNHIRQDDPNHSEYLWRLGNLLVLEGPINRHIKNREFSYKQTNGQNLDYENSVMSLPHDVSRYLVNGEWTFVSIEKRQDDLASNYACNTWPLIW